jgi:hypothetical protein
VGLRLWFPEFQNSTKIYEVDDADQKMHGYGITELVDPSLGTKEGYVFGTHRLWSIVFPLETETITAVVARRPDEVSKKIMLLVGECLKIEFSTYEPINCSSSHSSFLLTKHHGL